VIARLVLFGLLLALPAAVQADPVTLIAIGANLGFVGTAALVAGAAVSYGGYALLAANYIYGGMDARRRARNQAGDARRAYNAGLQDRNASVLQADPPWRVVYGACRTGGDIVAIFTSDKAGIRTDGSSYTKADGLKHLVVVVAAHEVDDITEMYLDGVAVGALDGSRWATVGDLAQARTVTQERTLAPGALVAFAGAVTVLSAQDANGYNGESGWTGLPVSYTVSGGTVTNTSGSVTLAVSVTYSVTTGALRWDKHLGTDSQTVDSYLTGLVPAQWGANDRLRGLAYVVVTLDLEDARFQAGPPQMAWDVRGRKVYDPRTTTTAWSDNPALCVRDYLLAPWGFEVLAADIDDSYTIAAANACDVSISFDSIDGGVTTTTAGATYTCNGALMSTDSRERALNDLCDAMGGYAVYGARWQIVAGAWTAPVMALTDDDLAGQIEVVQAGVSLDEVFNGVRGGYVANDAGVSSDFTYSNATFVAADGRALWTEVSLPFTNGAARARNLARIMVEANRDSQVIRFPASLRAWPLQVGDRVTVTSAEYGFTAKAYRVTDWAFGLQTPVMLTLQEDAAAVYDQADAAVVDPAPNTALPSPWVVAAIGAVSASSGTEQLQVMADGTVVARVLLQWPAVAAAYVADGSGYIDVQWRRVAQDAINSWRTLRVPGDAASAFITGASDGEVLTIGVTVVNGLGARSDTVFLSHTVIGKSEPPADVTAFTVIEGAGFSRSYFWDYATTTLDLAGFRVRYVDQSLAGVPWGSMAPLFEAGRLDRSAGLQTPADGEWRIGIKAYDTSGNESINARYLTVLMDQGSFGFPLQSVDAGALGWPGTKTGCGVLDYYLADAGTLTWATVPATWDAWLDWDGPSASPISYTHTTVDVGSTLSLHLRAGHVASGATTTEYQSSTDNITYTSWAAVPAGTISARYVRVRWTISGARPILYRARFTLYA
jgi:hypothetical protein